MAILLQHLEFSCMIKRPFHYPEDHGGGKPKELSKLLGPKSKISEKNGPKLKLSGVTNDFH